MGLILLIICNYLSFIFAYIDPGTGSILLQALIGGIAGLAIAVKLYWFRIKAFFGFKNKKIIDEEDDF